MVQLSIVVVSKLDNIVCNRTERFSKRFINTKYDMSKSGKLYVSKNIIGRTLFYPRDAFTVYELLFCLIGQYAVYFTL